MPNETIQHNAGIQQPRVSPKAITKNELRTLVERHKNLPGKLNSLKERLREMAAHDEKDQKFIQDYCDNIDKVLAAWPSAWEQYEVQDIHFDLDALKALMTFMNSAELAEYDAALKGLAVYEQQFLEETVEPITSDLTVSALRQWIVTRTDYVVKQKLNDFVKQQKGMPDKLNELKDKLELKEWEASEKKDPNFDPEFFRRHCADVDSALAAWEKVWKKYEFRETDSVEDILQNLVALINSPELAEYNEALKRLVLDHYYRPLPDPAVFDPIGPLSSLPLQRLVQYATTFQSPLKDVQDAREIQPDLYTKEEALFNKAVEKGGEIGRQANDQVAESQIKDNLVARNAISGRDKAILNKLDYLCGLLEEKKTEYKNRPVAKEIGDCIEKFKEVREDYNTGKRSLSDFQKEMQKLYDEKKDSTIKVHRHGIFKKLRSEFFSTDTKDILRAMKNLTVRIGQDSTNELASSTAPRG